jgi:AraC family L-rhamnose operon transcriptional activator RhaR
MPKPAIDSTASPAALARQRFFDIDHLHVRLRLGSYRVETLYWGVLEGRWWRNYLHAHSFVEFCYAFAGKGQFNIREKQIPIQKGDLFLAVPGAAHEIVSSRPSPLGIYFWAFTLLHDPPAHTNGVESAIDALLEPLGTAKEYVARPPADMGVTLELLTQEITRKSAGYTQAIHGLATKLILEGCRAFAGPTPAEQIASNERGAKAVAQTAARYLRDNFARPISVRDVAAQVHLSERHLARLFLQETGSSILDYLTNLRVETAAQLLLDEKFSIKQVARAVGYPDPHYFTTLFGKRMGMTPGLFRQRRGTRYADETRRPK